MCAMDRGIRSGPRLGDVALVPWLERQGIGQVVVTVVFVLDAIGIHLHDAKAEWVLGLAHLFQGNAAGVGCDQLQVAVPDVGIMVKMA